MFSPGLVDQVSLGLVIFEHTLNMEAFRILFCLSPGQRLFYLKSLANCHRREAQV